MSMTAMCAGKEIAITHGRARAYCDGFHADVKMGCPWDKARFIMNVYFALEGTDKTHSPVPIEPVRRRDGNGIRNSLSSMHSHELDSPEIGRLVSYS
jgi:hypothetical protein